MELPKISIYIIVMIVFSSCYYDNEEELYPKINGEIGDVSYSMDIVPILEKNCYVCHAEAVRLGNVNLEGYFDLIDYVDDGSFIGAITHDPAYSPMPKGGPMLRSVVIDSIRAWIDQGALNN